MVLPMTKMSRVTSPPSKVSRAIEPKFRLPTRLMKRLACSQVQPTSTGPKRNINEIWEGTIWPQEALQTLQNLQAHYHTNPTPVHREGPYRCRQREKRDRRQDRLLAEGAQLQKICVLGTRLKLSMLRDARITERMAA